MKRTLIVMAAMWMASANSHANTVTAAQDPWPPFVTDDQAMPGVSVEILAAALKTQGMEVDFKIMPWSRALEETSKGRLDLLPATWFTQERTEYLVYSESYLENELSFIKRADDGFEFTDISSLNGKSVGVVRGYGYGDEFLSAANFNKPEANDLVSNLKKLMAQRIDLTLEDKLVALSSMKEAGLESQDFAFSSTALSTNPLHVTSGKANPNSTLYIEAYNRGLAEIKSNGTFDAILAKYGIK
ncbi:transporter substrate-binding domain-containing protein [Zobellella iuensis]|uniref:Transporter substrate-binding domain-containing protein n=1 Tax=Zobellella iuensis TaxID=2803811 RepID=A0ABS1QLN5_9GAMM|nr:transporter substrate-binding domain-containing protein [Zobellella iuensis]MBL1375776.1 transporter substrate-binding domain-containing protein [Zobellella iuensis]